MIIGKPLVGGGDCNDGDCATVDVQLAAWHDDKICTITRFLAFVQHQHVKANQNTCKQTHRHTEF